MKYITFLLFIFMPIMAVKLEDISTGMSAAGSGVKILRYTYKGGKFLKNYFYPSEIEACKQRRIKRQLNILAAEQKLDACLIDHAFDTEVKKIFDCKCKNETDEFIKTTGYQGYNAKKEDFIDALRQLEKENLKPKIVKIQSNGRTITGILIGGTIFTAGLALATVATIVTANPVIGYGIVNTCAPMAGSFIIPIVGTQTIAMGTASIMGNISAASAITAGQVIEKMNTTAAVLQIADAGIQVGDTYIRPYIYRTNEEELEYQKKLWAQKTSLYERIKEKYFECEKNK